MLIDINASVGHWPFRKTYLRSCKDLLARMNKYGADISVVSNINGIFYKDTQAANEELYQEIRSDRSYRKRFIPFAVINPIYAGWKDDIEICRTEFAFRGIRLYPQYHDYEITDPACIELVKHARDLGLIIAFTIRMVDSRPRSWMDLSKEWRLGDVLPIIKEVPDAKYFVLNVSDGMMVKDEDELIIKKSQILFDTSGKNISNLGELINKFGKHKFAFGSHSPILDYLTGLLRIEALREEEADETVREMLRSGNARSYLGL